LEKIFLAIILLNIVASIFASRRKKKKAQEAARRQGQPVAKPAPAQKRQKEPIRTLPQTKAEKPKKKDPPVRQKALNSGKSVLDQLARELGLGFQTDKGPPSPPPEYPYQEMIDGQIFPDSLQEPEFEEEALFETDKRQKQPDTQKPYVQPGKQPVKSQKKPLIFERLKNIDSLREAIILKTILDPPLAVAKRRK